MYSVWDYKYHLSPHKINSTLQGDAISTRFSGFWLNTYKIMFDAGLKSPFNPEHIFISHTHRDHIGELYDILSHITTRPTVYVPKGAEPLVQNYLNSMKQMCSMDAKAVHNRCDIVEVKDGDQFNIVANKTKLRINIFKTDHSIESVGFAFSEHRSRLKPEYKELSGLEIGKIRKSGITVSEDILVPQLIYTGDTRGTIFDTGMIDWKSYKVILTECTFIQGLSPNIDIPAMAEEKTHNYLESLEKVAERYPDTTFILCHWSLRYKKTDIKEYFKKKDYKNIVPWLNM
jgi:ribonuclease Z